MASLLRARKERKRQETLHVRQMLQEREKEREEERSKWLAAEAPTGHVSLNVRVRGSAVKYVVPLPEGNLLATGCEDGHIRIYELGGGSGGGLDPIRDIVAHVNFLHHLVALGKDVLVSKGGIMSLSTWSVKTGMRLDEHSMGSFASVDVITAVRPGRVVVGGVPIESRGMPKPILLLYAHNNGCGLSQIWRVDAAHGRWSIEAWKMSYLCLSHVAACRNIIATTANPDNNAKVWEATTGKKLAVLRGVEKCPADYVSVSDSYIAAASCFDKSVRVYRNDGDFAHVASLERLHEEKLLSISLVGDSLVMSASEKTISFTPIFAGSQPSARVSTAFQIVNVEILADGRIIACGEDGVDVFQPPAAVADLFRLHASAVYPSASAVALPSEPLLSLQEAWVRVSSGLLTAGDACRELVNKENCSKSIDEWWYGHLLLMDVVRSGEVLGGLHFDGADYHWFEQVYTPKTPLAMGATDLRLVKRCLRDAKAAGVVESPEAALAYILGRQDLIDEVHKLQDAGESMLYLLSRALLEQAAMDVELRELRSKLNHQARVQKMSLLLNAVFSFAPLAGGAAAGAGAAAFSWADSVPDLVESILGTGVGLQGAATPVLLETFLAGADAMIAPNGWALLDKEVRAEIVLAAEELGMSWEDFCAMIRRAASKRRRGVEGSDLRASGSDESRSDDAVVVQDVTGNTGRAPCDLFALTGDEVDDGACGVVSDSSSVAVVENVAGDAGRDVCALSGDEADDDAMEISDSSSVVHSEWESVDAVRGVDFATFANTMNANEPAERDGEPSELAMRSARVSLSTASDSLIDAMASLRVQASDQDAVRDMDAAALSRLFAGAMLNFRECFAEQMPVLENCLNRVLISKSVDGEVVVDLLPEDDVFCVVVGGLREIDAYVELGDACNIFESRFRPFLTKLRS